MSNYGYCSRRKAEDLIKEGRVEVNGKTISIGDSASESDEIKIDGKPINMEKKVYLIFNKPIHCVTALNDEHHRTIMEYIHIKERIFPIGRLDFNTTGLLLFTNDGDFANKIMHPSNEIKKTYRVETHDPLDRYSMDIIERGVMLEDGKTAPAKVKEIKENLIELTIHEGKNRIIRRMMKKIGHRVKSIERIRVGNLGLGNLKAGEYRNLTQKEKDKIFNLP
jgi:23S rRNA pseudouridine2605 synthase|tara:strand:- start:716 stop:1381 length:666 start_codon:yes stop_codon:yes gene_type:complete